MVACLLVRACGSHSNLGVPLPYPTPQLIHPLLRLAMLAPTLVAWVFAPWESAPASFLRRCASFFMLPTTTHSVPLPVTGHPSASLYRAAAPPPGGGGFPSTRNGRGLASAIVRPLFFRFGRGRGRPSRAYRRRE